MANGKVRAAIRASAAARKVNAKLPHQLRVCWGGLNHVECNNDAKGLVDSEGWNCCAAHGGKKEIP